MNLKKLTAAFLSAAMCFGCVSAFAENTDDYEFDKDEPIDFCVYNIWAENFVTAPTADIQSIKMTVDVTGFDADVDAVNTKLYSRESVTWETHASDIVTINGDGTYTYYIAFDEAFAPDQLCTIYIKDVLVALTDEDPDGQGADIKESKAHMNMKLVSCEFNKEAPSGGENAGDVAPIAYLAALVAVAGIAMAISKKRA